MAFRRRDLKVNIGGYTAETRYVVSVTEIRRGIAVCSEDMHDVVQRGLNLKQVQENTQVKNLKTLWTIGTTQVKSGSNILTFPDYIADLLSLLSGKKEGARLLNNIPDLWPIPKAYTEGTPYNRTLWDGCARDELGGNVQMLPEVKVADDGTVTEVGDSGIKVLIVDGGRSVFNCWALPRMRKYSKNGRGSYVIVSMPSDVVLGVQSRIVLPQVMLGGLLVQACYILRGQMDYREVEVPISTKLGEFAVQKMKVWEAHVLGTRAALKFMEEYKQVSGVEIDPNEQITASVKLAQQFKKDAAAGPSKGQAVAAVAATTALKGLTEGLLHKEFGQLARKSYSPIGAHWIGQYTSRVSGTVLTKAIVQRGITSPKNLNAQWYLSNAVVLYDPDRKRDIAKAVISDLFDIGTSCLVVAAAIAAPIDNSVINANNALELLVEKTCSESLGPVAGVTPLAGVLRLINPNNVYRVINYAEYGQFCLTQRKKLDTSPIKGGKLPDINDVREYTLNAIGEQYGRTEQQDAIMFELGEAAKDVLAKAAKKGKKTLHETVEAVRGELADTTTDVASHAAWLALKVHVMGGVAVREGISHLFDPKNLDLKIFKDSPEKRFFEFIDFWGMPKLFSPAQSMTQNTADVFGVLKQVWGVIPNEVIREKTYKIVGGSDEEGVRRFLLACHLIRKPGKLTQRYEHHVLKREKSILRRDQLADRYQETLRIIATSRTDCPLPAKTEEFARGCLMVVPDSPGLHFTLLVLPPSDGERLPGIEEARTEPWCVLIDGGTTATGTARERHQEHLAKVLDTYVPRTGEGGKTRRIDRIYVTGVMPDRFNLLPSTVGDTYEVGAITAAGFPARYLKVPAGGKPCFLTWMQDKLAPKKESKDHFDLSVAAMARGLINRTSNVVLSGSDKALQFISYITESKRPMRVEILENDFKRIRTPLHDDFGDTQVFALSANLGGYAMEPDPKKDADNAMVLVFSLHGLKILLAGSMTPEVAEAIRQTRADVHVYGYDPLHLADDSQKVIIVSSYLDRDNPALWAWRTEEEEQKLPLQPHLLQAFRSTGGADFTSDYSLTATAYSSRETIDGDKQTYRFYTVSTPGSLFGSVYQYKTPV